jgi:hypothetical protein
MVKYFSDQNQVGFFYESGTYATISGTTPQWIGMVQEHSPSEEVGVISVRYQGSTDRNVDTFVDGPIDVNGTITYYPQDWKFLGFAIGSVGETATAGSHVFTETNSDDKNYAIQTQSLSSFTIIDSKDNSEANKDFTRIYNGALVNSFTINVTQSEPITCEVSYIAQTGSFTSGTITAVTAGTSRPYMWSDCSLHIPSGTKLSNITDLTFTINNNLEPQHYVNGSRVIGESLPLNRDYEVSTTAVMDTTNAFELYNNYFKGGSVFNALLHIAGTPGSLGVVMSGCKMATMDIPSMVEGVQEQTFTFIPQHVYPVASDSVVNYNAW